MADPGGGAGPGYERRERGRSRDGAGGALEECRGVVKFYNAAKGYGFVVPDGGRDVLVHESVLNRAGLEPGQRVSVMPEFDSIWPGFLTRGLRWVFGLLRVVSGWPGCAFRAKAQR